MGKMELSYNARKAMSVHIGETATTELVTLLQRLTERIDDLERRKVDVMPIVAVPRADEPATLRFSGARAAEMPRREAA